MERYDFRTKRLFIEHELAKGSTLTADRAQANYLLNVLRLKEGDAVLLFNGRDGEWLARIAPTGRKACDLVPERQTRAQHGPYDLLYCFAPLKQTRLDYMMEKAVEMGVGRLQPVITDYTQVKKINPERLNAHFVEAAEQCGILTLPKLAEPVKLDTLLHSWSLSESDRALIFCDELASSAENIDRLKALEGKPLALLIGPEGGFTDTERAALRACDFVTGLSLGPRILRADTAAVAALAMVQSIIGDYR